MRKKMMHFPMLHPRPHKLEFLMLEAWNLYFNKFPGDYYSASLSWTDDQFGESLSLRNKDNLEESCFVL